jgi:starch synthase
MAQSVTEPDVLPRDGRAPSGRDLRVLHVAAEGLPFSKTGGLGDVIGSLPAALAAAGVEVGVAIPTLSTFPEAAPAPRRTGRRVGGESGPARREDLGFEVLEASIGGVRYLLLDNPRLFGRAGLYTDEDGRDYADNWLRFAAFAAAAAELAAAEGFDLVHCHDWQAALLPVYEAARGERTGEVRRFRTLLTVHNMAYQGAFPAAIWPGLGLPDDWFRPEGLEFYDKVNFLKGGLVFADWLTTVSPTYAREILSPEHGAGLEGVLRARRGRLTGILNGVDYSVWDPAVDRFIARRYGPGRLRGKALCKSALQELLGLDRDPDAPLAGVVSRLVEQKGWELLVAVLPRFLEQGLQLAVLGTGEPRLERALRALARAHPRRAGVRIDFDLELAHRIEAGADIYLMPSRFEPCGLNQMYSLRYGTVPVVRATGGLADTIVDASDPERGTGYRFDRYSPEAFAQVLARALEGYRHTEEWRAIQRRGMRQDFSWSVSAAAYLELYLELAGRPVPGAWPGEAPSDERAKPATVSEAGTRDPGTEARTPDPGTDARKPSLERRPHRATELHSES